MTWLLLLTLAAAQPHRSETPAQPRAAQASCTDALAYQVRLDRLGFSVGEIDGTPGPNVHKAVAAFQEEKKLAGAGQLTCETLHALEEESSGPLLTEYTITEHDAAGPFLDRPLPKDLPEQATLGALSYQSLAEAIAERFHASPRLLARLNPRAHFAAGTKIRVPDVTPFNSATRPKPDTAKPITIHVSRSRSTLRAVTAGGELVMFAPVTSGSEHDPLPLGN